MSTTYKIKQGDTLSGIASKYGTSVSQLASLNKISNPNLIMAGDTLKISADNSKLSGLLETKDSSGSIGSNFTYNPFNYDSYTESDDVNATKQNKTNAENALAGLGDYAYAGQEKLDDWMKQYENREDFSYVFNTDALYQQYKDKYIQQGKMAMADTIGQASAMTGGYGNSYAATAGNQAYQSHLQNLNDVIPELYQMAYDRYNQKGQDMLNIISLLRGERDFDYGTWADKKNSLLADRDYYSNQFNNERNWDYSKYSDDRNLAYNEHTTGEGYRYQDGRDAVADAQWQATFDEGKRQFDEQMAFNKQQYNDSKTVSSGGSYSGGSSGSGGSLGGSTSLADIPSEYKTKAASFKNNTSLENYLDGLEGSGAITTNQADALYAMYKDDNEKYVLDEKGDPTDQISYKDMAKNTNGWKVVKNGGINWWGGVDNNAIVEAPNGEQIRLDRLVDVLESEGMKRNEAKALVQKLQGNLDI